MQFDIRALMIASTLVMMLLSLLDIVIWRTRNTFPGFGRWAVGHALVGPTLLLYALRSILPDFLTIVIANALSIGTSIIVLEAAREFRGLKPRAWQPYVGGICALGTIIYFRYSVNNLNARGFVALVCTSTIGLLSAKALLTNVPKERTVGLRYTGWLVLVCALLMMGRGIYYLWQPPTSELFLWSMPNLVAYVGLSLGLTGISYGVLVISGERLMADLRESERRTARLNMELNRLRRGLETAVVERTAELRKTQSELLQSQKLESLGRLAGGVAHDFNNFLTVIHGYTRLLLQGLEPENRLRDDVVQIGAACDQALLMTQQLLAFSRRQSLEWKVLDLNEVIQGMTKMLAHLLGDDVEVVITPRASKASVKADSGQMHQVILNLFLNARDAMPNGGRLEISTADVELTEADSRRLPGTVPGKYVELLIRDTGTGMDTATQAHIFEPFFTTKPQGQGTGLGLATVYGIVRQSGGHIHVETAPGEGAAFRLVLPVTTEEIAQQDRPQVSVSAEALAPAARARILVVDDAAAIRKVLRRVLESAGYDVMEAADADAALYALRHAQLDIVLTDLQMPGRSGVDLARLVARDYPAAKVLAMSGFEDTYLGQLPKEIGIEAALTKPMQPEVLLSAVRAALAKPEKAARA